MHQIKNKIVAGIKQMVALLNIVILYLLSASSYECFKRRLFHVVSLIINGIFPVLENIKQNSATPEKKNATPHNN